MQQDDKGAVEECSTATNLGHVHTFHFPWSDGDNTKPVKTYQRTQWQQQRDTVALAVAFELQVHQRLNSSPTKMTFKEKRVSAANGEW